MFDWLTRKVLGWSTVGSLLLSGALAIALAWQASELSSAKEVIQGLTGWRDEMVGSIRLASGNSAVTVTTANQQVQALGQSYTALKGSVATANSALDQLALDSKRAKEAAAREETLRAAAISNAADLRAQLKTQAASSVPKEQMEATVRQLQDKLYEVGL